MNWFLVKNKTSSMTEALSMYKEARAPRDYKREYAQYHSKQEQIDRRSTRNKARRKLGLEKGDPREVDHKTPLSKGGGNSDANLRAVSLQTNRKKFTKTAGYLDRKILDLGQKDTPVGRFISGALPAWMDSQGKINTALARGNPAAAGAQAIAGLTSAGLTGVGAINPTIGDMVAKYKKAKAAVKKGKKQVGRASKGVEGADEYIDSDIPGIEGIQNAIGHVGNLFDSASELVKLSNRHHHLITGVPGSGKSTLAKRIAKEKGLPLFELDSDPRFKEALQLVDEGKMDESNALQRQMFRDAVARKDPHVIEGAQVMLDPALARQHELQILDDSADILAPRWAKREAGKHRDRALSSGRKPYKDEAYYDKLYRNTVYPRYQKQLEGLRKTASDHHHLVTGHSGAGKSTLARKLSEETGAPIVALDDAPSIRAILQEQKDMARARPDGKLTLTPELIKKYQAVELKAIQDALASKDPSIIEGSYFLKHNPDMFKGHKMMLVDRDRDTILNQRVERQRLKDLGRGREWSDERAKGVRTRGGQLLDYYQPGVDTWRGSSLVEKRAFLFSKKPKESYQQKLNRLGISDSKELPMVLQDGSFDWSGTWAPKDSKDKARLERIALSLEKTAAKLYHGSPHEGLTSLQPRAPRGNTDYERQQAVFMTDNPDAAALYALARDKERKNRGWAAIDGRLQLGPNATLNEKGYIYNVDTDDYLSPPKGEESRGFAIPREIGVAGVKEVTPSEYEHLIDRFDTKDAFNRHVNSLVEKMTQEKKASICESCECDPCDCGWGNYAEKTAKALSAKGRNQISEGNFALPGRRYPIHDINHGRNALSRVSQHGSEREKKQVRSAVVAKYPSLKKKASVGLGRVLKGALPLGVAGGVAGYGLTEDEDNKVRNSLLGAAGGLTAGGTLGYGYHKLNPVMPKVKSVPKPKAPEPKKIKFIDYPPKVVHPDVNITDFGEGPIADRLRDVERRDGLIDTAYGLDMGFDVFPTSEVFEDFSDAELDSYIRDFYKRNKLKDRGFILGPSVGDDFDISVARPADPDADQWVSSRVTDVRYPAIYQQDRPPLFYAKADIENL